MTDYVPMDSGGFIIIFNEDAYTDSYRDFVHGAFTKYDEYEAQAEYKMELLKEGQIHK